MLDKMWHLLLQIKEEPEKYIGEPNLEYMEKFWNGMLIAYQYMGGTCFDKLSGFRDFLVKKYSDPGGGFGYIQIIQRNSRSERDAFYLFYNLLDEFLDLKGNDYKPFASCDIDVQLFPALSDEKVAVWNTLQNHRTAVIAIGGYSLKMLKQYLAGAKHYAICLKNKELDVLPGFEEYIQQKFNEMQTYDIFQLICENSESEKAAFANFYAYMDEFLLKMGPDYEPVVEIDSSTSTPKYSGVICKTEISTS